MRGGAPNVSMAAACSRTGEETLLERGKDGLVVLNEHPLSAETPAHLLDDAITPSARHFVRNNGIPPEGADAARSRSLTICCLRALRTARWCMISLALVAVGMLLDRCGDDASRGVFPLADQPDPRTGPYAVEGREE